MDQAPPRRPLFWEGSAKHAFLRFPLPVQKDLGVALFVVQIGETPPSAKPWKGLGPGVYELVDDHRGDTYRAVYTLRVAGNVHVLHAFQKKSKHGIKTPKPDIELIERRLKIVWRATARGADDMTRPLRRRGTDNVLVDLGLPDAEELTAKVVLAKKINDILARRELTQSAAAKLLGIPQPKISAIRNYKIRGISLERLMQALTALGQNVEIVVSPSKKSSAARIAVAA